MFGPSPCPWHYPGVGLLWPLLTPVFASYELLRITLYDSFSVCSSLFRISRKRLSFHNPCRDIWVPVAPTGYFTENYIIPHGKQVSPDKNVNFPCVTASFTVSPVPWASTCCAALPRDSALYDVSVRQFTSLHLGFLQTLPHGNALAIG